jgi:hypothetical protein
MNWIHLRKNLIEIEKILKMLLQSLETKPLTPLPLESLAPLFQPNWRRFYIFCFNSFLDCTRTCALLHNYLCKYLFDFLP